MSTRKATQGVLAPVETSKMNFKLSNIKNSNELMV